MRFILFIILVGLISAIAESIFPWWMIAVVPFLISITMNMKGGISFLAGFLGIALFWFIAALTKDIPNDHILSRRMAALFHLSDYGLLLFAVALSGGLVGGMAAWAGALMRIRKHK